MKIFIVIFSFAFPNGTPEDSLAKNYYLELSNIHDPKTLNRRISENKLNEFNEFFISYSDEQKRVHKIEFISANKIQFSLEYRYDGRRLTRLKNTNFIGKSLTWCKIEYEKKTRTTKCFDEQGRLTLEELYFIRTKQYSTVTYDSTGAETLIEYGKY